MISFVYSEYMLHYSNIFTFFQTKIATENTQTVWTLLPTDLVLQCCT